MCFEVRCCVLQCIFNSAHLLQLPQLKRTSEPAQVRLAAPVLPPLVHSIPYCRDCLEEGHRGSAHERYRRHATIRTLLGHRIGPRTDPVSAAVAASVCCAACDTLAAASPPRPRPMLVYMARFAIHMHVCARGGRTAASEEDAHVAVAAAHQNGHHWRFELVLQLQLQPVLAAQVNGRSQDVAMARRRFELSRFDLVHHLNQLETKKKFQLVRTRVVRTFPYSVLCTDNLVLATLTLRIGC
jgi:hypothetical protein